MKIVCLSDTHRIVPELESNSLFPRQLATLSYEEAKILYEKIAREIQRAYSVAIEWLTNNGPWDLSIHLGDITGGYQEQGCFHPSALQIAKMTEEELRTISPKALFSLGNHDLGYSHPGSLPGSGINVTSINICKKIFGNLFWAQEEQGILLIGLCSSIAEYQGLNTEILSIQREQVMFLGDTLSGHRNKWMLFTHKFSTPKFFVKQISGHTENLQAMVCGDIHDPKKGKILKNLIQIPGLSLLASRKNRIVIECLKKCIFCPSTAPLWWQGYKLLTLDCKKETIISREIALKHPSDSEEIPTSSPGRCLWWMIRKKRT